MVHCAHLPLKTLFTGKCFTELEKIDSTNRYALELVHHGTARHGQVIVAREQTQGRGQRNKNWVSEPGKNLLSSFIYQFNHLPVGASFSWNMAVAAAVAQTISGIQGLENHTVEIKWPNDILVDKRKIAGILVENVIGQQSLRWTVAGVGVNVNQLFSESRDQIFPAVSLSQLLNNEFQISKILELLATEMEHAYFLFTGGKAGSLVKIYNTLLYGKNEWIPLSLNNKPFLGMIEKVSEDGRLHVISQNGESFVFTHGEIAFLSH